MKKGMVSGGLFCGALVMAAATAGAANAAEERWPRWYLGLTGSLAYQGDADIGTTGKLSYDQDFGMGAALGYRPNFSGNYTFLNTTRLEAELFYVESETDEFTTGGVSTKVNGDITTVAYMLNMMVDIPTGTRLTPYIGGGIGFADVELNSAGVGINDSDTAFAYQFRGGLAYSPETIPFVDLLAGYRYFATNDISLGNNTDVENSIHNAELGVRLNF